MMQIPLEIDHENLLAGAKLVIEHIFPEWNTKTVDIKQFDQGITNKLLQCRCKETEDTILVRVYGKKSEILINREQEMQSMMALYKNGFCPPIYARFRNGFVYGYVHGTALISEELSQGEKMYLIGKRLGEWHRLKMDKPISPSLFVTLRRWLQFGKFSIFGNIFHDKFVLINEISIFL